MFRDRLWMILVPLTLLLFITIYLLLPENIDTALTVGVHPAYLAGLAGEEGFEGVRLIPFDDPDALEKAVLSGETGEFPPPAAGISFPLDLMNPGDSAVTSVTVFLSEGVPSHLRHTLSAAVLEASLAIRAMASGRNPLSELPVVLPDLHHAVSGDVMSLAGFPIRQLMRPLMVMVILMMEALALAGLVSLEIEHRTAAAILVTPARISDLLIAKWLTGILLAVVQVMAFLLVTGTPWGMMPLLTVLMILGAMMMSAVGMISGATGKDFMGTLFLSMFFVIPMMIPVMSILLPGQPSFLMGLLPTTGLVRSLASVMGGGAGWFDVMPELRSILAWNAALFATAFLVLRRRIVSL